MSAPSQPAAAGPDLGGLEAITAAVQAGAGLPEVIRAAARALDASLVLTDRAGHILAAAAQSPAEERALLGDGAGVEVVDLRLADAAVGTLRMRARSAVAPALLRVVATLVASEVERLRGPERASEQAIAAFIGAVLAREVVGREEIVAGAAQLGLDLERGCSVLVVRVHTHVTAEDGWRARVQAVAERGARAAASGAAVALSTRVDGPVVELLVVVPDADEARAARAADAVLSELGAGLPGHTFALGRSRVAADPVDLARAGSEALLAANVAEGDPDRPALAFDDTGAYRLLLSAMSEDPGELQRFYGETIEPLAAYDDQYETELVKTVEAFLECDGSVAGTAQRLFTHRHTIRYRLERVRDLSGLDVGSSDGREKLSLGLKAMRVLGIARRGGPASEAGAGAGRVPRR